MAGANSLSSFGRLLREWRTRRRLSQLDLATDAGVSSRHLSFIETGRAQPSREMVLLLSRVLDVPLRERNNLLTAAGYAAMYGATNLEAPALAQARRALDFILRQQENAATTRLVEQFLDPAATGELGLNAMRLMFHPRGFRPHITNWEAMAAALIQWLHRDVLSGLADAETQNLLKELLSYPAYPIAGACSTSRSPPPRSCRSSSGRASSSCGTSRR